MTAVDWWPEQDGRITDGLTIMCNAEGATTEGAACKFGTSTASQIRVQDAAAVGDGFGIMLKAAASAGEGVPVLVYGLHKMTISGTFTQGAVVMNTATPTIAIAAGLTAITTLTTFGGNSRILGTAMQTAVTTADKCVIFIGKAF